MGTVHAKEREEGTVIDVGGGSHDRFGDNNNCDDGVRRPEQKQINLDGVRARVDRIHVEGLTRTKDDIVIDTVRDLFQAKDFQGMIREAHRVRGKLERLGCFRNIGIFIDVSKGPGSTPNGFEVTFHVKELKRIIGGVNTMVGNNEGSVVLGMRMPNMFGRGERLKAEYSYGSKKSSSFLAAFSKPFTGKFNPIFTTSVFQQGSEWPWSSYKQLERGLIFDLGFLSAPYVKHNIQWEGSWRDLSSLNRGSAFQIREQSGPTLKSSMRHILAVDRRDGCIFPTSGSLLQWTSEFAGLGGNVGFFKNDVLLQTNWPLFGGWVFQAAIQGGFLKRISDDRIVSMCDQFYLGGPLSLRGFQTRGVGPHADGSALGSDVFWAGALHLYTPLPFRPGAGGFGDLFRTHFFINAGNIGEFEFTEDYAHNVEELRKNVRMAYGLGVAMRLGQMARVELNYCFPVYFQKGDEPNPGIQFGVGVQFL